MPCITQYENGMSTECMAEIIIEKHRNGRTGSANLMFIKHLAKFIEPDSSVVHSPNDDFNADNTIIRGSRMNDIEEDL